MLVDGSVRIVNQHFLNQNPGLEEALGTDHRIVRDICDRFIRWGNLSTAQVALALKLAGEANKPAGTAPAGEWQGTVGKRQRFTMKLVKQLQLETQWGTSYLHVFTDEIGNNYKWFSSSGKLRNQVGNPIDLDAVVMVNATVKGHDTYNGAKQTSLSRVKLV